ncbi:HRDC domain-containing protein [Nanoarchaeota archaeon]
MKTEECERCSRKLNHKGRCLPCNYLYKYKSWIRGLRESKDYDSEHGIDVKLVKRLMTEKIFIKQEKLKSVPKTKIDIESTGCTGFLKAELLKWRNSLDNVFNLYKEDLIPQELRYFRNGWGCVSNKEINLLVKLKPKSLRELEKIEGFGKTKISKYGDNIINIIKENERD